VSAFMRAMAFKASERSTAFRRARECEIRGVSLSCSGDHETVTYSAGFLRDDAATAVASLADSVTKQQFYPWEVKDTKAFIKKCGAEVASTDAVVDAIHEGAFRTGLGNVVSAPR
jgi:predicted Zn-dependent peptidase